MTRITIALTLATTVATGCVTDRLRDDAARVFRDHNQVASELLLTLTDLADAAPEHFDRLAGAEQRMLEACEDLNALAVAHRDERAPTLAGGLGIRRVLRDCEQSTAEVEALLAELSQD